MLKLMFVGKLPAVRQAVEALKAAKRHEKMELQSPFRQDQVETKDLMSYAYYSQFAQALKALRKIDL